MGWKERTFVSVSWGTIAKKRNCRYELEIPGTTVNIEHDCSGCRINFVEVNLHHLKVLISQTRNFDITMKNATPIP
jgi:hypothetical protein